MDSQTKIELNTTAILMSNTFALYNNEYLNYLRILCVRFPLGVRCMCIEDILCMVHAPEYAPLYISTQKSEEGIEYLPQLLLRQLALRHAL